jgi:transcriptional regulator with XRE-family HTH domain
MDNGKLLGEFLRARREVTTPEQVELLDVGPRRTPGLRREEVAMLAGISTDYYVRMEQGREPRPSTQVLDALVQALKLDPSAAVHLYDLVFPRPQQRGTLGRTTRICPNLLWLMHHSSHVPALVFGRQMDVLAMNPLGAALHNGLEHTNNLLRMIFFDPAAREFFRDWEQVASARVAHLRAAAGADLDNPELTDLVGELSLKSGDFCRLWVRHAVACVPRSVRRFHHREAGDLDFTYEVFSTKLALDQRLLVFHPEPTGPFRHGLALLSSIASAPPVNPSPDH